jgi:hypothetical protein
MRASAAISSARTPTGRTGSRTRSSFAARRTGALLGALALAGCGSTAAGSSAAPPAGAKLLHWTGLEHVTRVLDLTAPRADGSIVVATNGHLALLTASDTLRTLAPTYRASAGLEPYIALSSGGCFGAGTVYALRLTANRGVTKIGNGGQVGDFARLPGPGLLNGIAFDATGRFAHRLLVTSTASGVTTVFAIDCRGRVKTVTRDGPKVEGGIAVAPASFGAYAGDLIAPNEVAGDLYAFGPSGKATLILRAPVPHGQDVGIESEGFVPAQFTEALVADRLTPKNRHPGDDQILRLGRAALRSAGVHAGQLLVVNEGGADTIVVRCASDLCSARVIATGPHEAHIEGHVVFAR